MSFAPDHYRLKTLKKRTLKFAHVRIVYYGIVLNVKRNSRAYAGSIDGDLPKAMRVSGFIKDVCRRTGKIGNYVFSGFIAASIRVVIGSFDFASSIRSAVIPHLFEPSFIASKTSSRVGSFGFIGIAMKAYPFRIVATRFVSALVCFAASNSVRSFSCSPLSPSDSINSVMFPIGRWPRLFRRHSITSFFLSSKIGTMPTCIM